MIDSERVIALAVSIPEDLRFAVAIAGVYETGRRDAVAELIRRGKSAKLTHDQAIALFGVDPYRQEIAT